MTKKSKKNQNFIGHWQ